MMARRPHIPQSHQRPQRCRRGSAGGFTLIEVLATLLLLGIVVPVAMRGVSLATAAASRARHTTEATSLAETKLNEIITQTINASTGTWADFGPEWPGYQWTCNTAGRDYGVTEVAVSVKWKERNQDRVLTVTTMMLPESSTSSTSSSSSTGVAP